MSQYSATAAAGAVGSSNPDDIRAHIIASLFSRYDESGTAEETLISFVKVLERDDSAPGSSSAGTPGVGPGESGGAGGDKTRYLMLAVTKLGKVVLHKAKRNSNMTFSKGKTWGLEDVRAVEVVHVSDRGMGMQIITLNC